MCNILSKNLIQSEFNNPSHEPGIVISLEVKLFSIIKQLLITTIIVTSVLILGATWLGSIVLGQPNNSTYQITNPPDAVFAGGGGRGSAVGSESSDGSLIILN